jgi:hypothetical protein
MKSDISRDTFTKKKHYDSVRAQQGRVMLDADLNEQCDIERYRAETGTADIIGMSGAPVGHSGFRIITNTLEKSGFIKEITPKIPDTEIIGDYPEKKSTFPDFLISAGRFYIDGILCENETVTPYFSQPDLPGVKSGNKGYNVRFNEKDKAGSYLVYLDCWKRLMSAIEDPEIREVALGGPDTATRSKVVWQVKVLRLESEPPIGDFRDYMTSGAWKEIHDTQFDRKEKGRLSAKIADKPASAEACSEIISPGYSGEQNQLYRVEIHTGGPAGKATFKWSRENGSVVARCLPLENYKKKCVLQHPVKDDIHGFEDKSWVEITDDFHELWETPGQIVKIGEIDGLEITVNQDIEWDSFNVSKTKIRRWENDDITNAYTPADSVEEINLASSDNAIPVTAGLWYELENNIQVKFEGDKEYRTGDYWLIPARTLRPLELEGWEAGTPRPPHGPEHHYCPLALLKSTSKEFSSNEDCRPVFQPTSEIVTLYKTGGDGQEVIWDPQNAENKIRLPLPLKVAVARGRWYPGNDRKTRVIFRVTSGEGWLTEGDPNNLVSPGEPLPVQTDENGVARCYLYAGKGAAEKKEATQPPTITVRATLEDNYHDDLDSEYYRPGQVFTATVHVLDAGLISYAPSEDCQILSRVNTVRDALDTLCKKRDNICTITVNPATWKEAGENWEKYLNFTGQKIDTTGAGVKICFQAGTFEIKERTPIDIGGSSSLMISGCGHATKIIISGAESAFVLHGWENVQVIDLAAESDLASSGDEKTHLNGTLTFYGCSRVTVERVHLKCGEGPWRAASCINVRETKDYQRTNKDPDSKNLPEANAEKSLVHVPLVRIRDCNLHIGHRQAGILLVNVERSDISGNVLEVYDREQLQFIGMLKDLTFAKNISRLVIPAPRAMAVSGKETNPVREEPVRAAQVKREKTGLATNVIPFPAENEFLVVEPAREMAPYVSSFITALVPKEEKSADKKYEILLNRTALVLSSETKWKGDAVLEAGVTGIFSQLDKKFKQHAFGSQGIVIGGQYAQDIHIHNNVLVGVAQGIHVGLSKREDAASAPLYANIVHIRDNTIRLNVMQGIHAHHGIFTGNCLNQVIRENHISCIRFASLKQETKEAVAYPVLGIQANGYLGPMMIIGENHMIDMDTGIEVTVQNREMPKKRIWLVLNNFASGTCVILPDNGVVVSNNNI